MAKISEVVSLKSGYANFVELKSAFESVQENADRMAMYRPTKSHRVALERICRGLYQLNDKKFYLLSGSYGTGKSHLCLIIANLLSRTSNDPDITDFYENYTKLDSEKAKLLKQIRRDGQYLVAICDYHSGRKFEDVVMQAVFDACKSNNLDTSIRTMFDEAERLLVEWEQIGDEGMRNFYLDFSKALEIVEPRITVHQLRLGLKRYDSDALEKFRSAFREMMGSLEFQTRAGNLIPIIQNLVKSDEFKSRFKGLAIFYDEFGSTLENTAYAKNVLQGFMEKICKVIPNVLFIGCIHKDFKSYADRLNKDDIAVMNDRISHIPLLNEGIEEIISAIVETEKNNEFWTGQINQKTKIFDQLVPLCITLDLFPWIDNVSRIRKSVLEDIYGVHPMALSCLLKLSSEIGSDARSTFTFFSGEVGGKEGSYEDFIAKSEILDCSGKLNLYTVDNLFTFFENELSQGNRELRGRQRQAVNGYYASLEALRKAVEGELVGFQDDERIQVLQTILIYQLCQIPANLENIQFGLYCFSRSEKQLVKRYLNKLKKDGAVFLRQQSKTYELATDSGEDPYDLIQRFEDDVTLHPSDMIKAFLEESTSNRIPHFCKANGYNMPYNEDKRCRIRFVRANDLGNRLLKDIRDECARNRDIPAKSFEGTLVYVLCEKPDEVKLARETAKFFVDKNLAVGVPHNPQPFSITLLKVKACRHYLPPNEAEKISAQTESRLRDIFENSKDGYLPMLQRKFQNIMEGNQICWYWREGKILVDRPGKSHTPADMLCQELYKNRCRIKHPDLNFCRDPKWRTARNNSLKQAICVLLGENRVFIDNSNPESHGQKRYLEKVLLKGAGALRRVDSIGTITYFECETDSTKIHDDFPVLKNLCNHLNNLKSGEKIAIGNYLKKVKNAPYGVGGTSLILSLAHVIRAYGERLIVYKDSTLMVEQPLRTYEDLVEIVSNVTANTVFVVRDFSKAQKIIVKQFAEHVGAPALRFGFPRTLNSAFESILKWWNKLPKIAKVIALYEEDKRETLSSLINLLNGLTDNLNQFDVMFEQLPEIYRSDLFGKSLTESDANEICKRFGQDVGLLNLGENIAQTKIAQSICEILGTYGDIVECEKVVSEWYRNLNPIQRNPLKCDQKEAKQFLMYMSDQSISFSEKIYRKLPEDYGFGPVLEWKSLYIDDYKAKLEQVKSKIDEFKPPVGNPAIQEGVHEVRESQQLKVKVPKGAVQLIYTLDEKDPRDSGTAKKSDSTIDLVRLLNDRPRLKVNLVAKDQEGNFSDTVSVELINEERQFEVQVDQNIFGTKKATFNFPEDTEGLVATLRSILDYSVNQNLLSKDKADQICLLLVQLTRIDEETGI